MTDSGVLLEEWVMGSVPDNAVNENYVALLQAEFAL
jgi:hypothetical protein